MRWLWMFVLLFGLAQAQVPGIVPNELIFIVRSADGGPLTLEEENQLAQELLDEGFVLQFALPSLGGSSDFFSSYNEGFSEDAATPAERLFSLNGAYTDDFADSPCSGALGRVAVKDGRIENYGDTLSALQTALNGSGLEVFGIDPEPSLDTGQSPMATGDFITDIKLKAAYTSEVYGAGTIIAILDTGVSAFSVKSVPLQEFLTGPGLDFVELDTGVTDEFVFYDPDNINPANNTRSGHGTAVAALAHLVAPGAQILPLRVCDENGRCLGSRVIAATCYALNFAESQGKNLVLNMSFGSEYDKIEPIEGMKAEPLFSNFFDSVTTKAPIAASVGNTHVEDSSASSSDDAPRYPAAFDFEGLVATTALQYENGSWRVTDKSTRGGFVEIAAPGSNLLNVGATPISAAKLKEPATGYSGTSFATPLVAGTMALMLDANPGLSPALIEECLVGAAKPLAGSQSLGMLNVGAAVEAALEALNCTSD